MKPALKSFLGDSNVEILKQIHEKSSIDMKMTLRVVVPLQKPKQAVGSVGAVPISVVFLLKDKKKAAKLQPIVSWSSLCDKASQCFPNQLDGTKIGSFVVQETGVSIENDRDVEETEISDQILIIEMRS